MMRRRVGCNQICLIFSRFFWLNAVGFFLLLCGLRRRQNAFTLTHSRLKTLNRPTAKGRAGQNLWKHSRFANILASFPPPSYKKNCLISRGGAARQSDNCSRSFVLDVNIQSRLISSAVYFVFNFQTRFDAYPHSILIWHGAAVMESKRRATSRPINAHCI